jgi:3-oxoadipate enol-lactonase
VPFTNGPDGTSIHYVVSGPADAEPLLLLQGLGADHRGWIMQRRALSRRYRCILVDNRGVGRSGRPAGPYDLEVMAADAVAVLDAEGVERAHVMGASMGGVLAQILAVRHADRVRSLVLACTACRHLPWRRELLHDWATVATEQGMRAMTNRGLRWLVGPRHRRRFGLPFGVFGSLLLNVPSSSFVAQVRAILDMDDGLRHELTGIAVPTMVVVGSQDILTPCADSEELAELIPGAELAVIGGAAHGLMVEHAGTFNRVVEEFLAGVADAAPVAPLPQRLTA